MRNCFYANFKKAFDLIRFLKIKSPSTSILFKSFQTWNCRVLFQDNLQLRIITFTFLDLSNLFFNTVSSLFHYLLQLSSPEVTLQLWTDKVPHKNRLHTSFFRDATFVYFLQMFKILFMLLVIKSTKCDNSKRCLKQSQMKKLIEKVEAQQQYLIDSLNQEDDK